MCVRLLVYMGKNSIVHVLFLTLLGIVGFQNNLVHLNKWIMCRVTEYCRRPDRLKSSITPENNLSCIKIVDVRYTSKVLKQCQPLKNNCISDSERLKLNKISA